MFSCSVGHLSTTGAHNSTPGRPKEIKLAPEGSSKSDLISRKRGMVFDLSVYLIQACLHNSVHYQK